MHFDAPNHRDEDFASHAFFSISSKALGPGPKPKTSRPAAQRRIYPYLLRGLAIDRPNQVWAADITDIPMARGFLNLVAVID